jgi:hypothetical protein
MKKITLLILVICSGVQISNANLRWKINSSGGITWQVNKNESHHDHVEMSGLYTSSIVHYGIKDNQLVNYVHLVFPMLRTIPNNTHASFSFDFDLKEHNEFYVNSKKLIEKPLKFSHKGILKFESKLNRDVFVVHQQFPSSTSPVFIDYIEIQNRGTKEYEIEIPKLNYKNISDKTKGVDGSYIVEAQNSKSGKFKIKPQESIKYAVQITARKTTDVDQYYSSNYELNKRVDFVNESFSKLELQTPNVDLNTAFNFAKLRAVESIFNTKGGLMHAPGGGHYYAAIWANDQAEYANPFFPFLGMFNGNESAINSFRHFARFMNPEYKDIPSSIIAEGIDIWNGAGDRGDMAMIAYGASRFALTYGDLYTAKELWPLIEWCLEHSRRNINKHGVVSSDSDELEGRFPAGKANLNTSCLYYDALLSASYLGSEIGIDQNQIVKYKNQATNLKMSIEKYFGAKMRGYDTYKYFEGNKKLRAWICTPLTVDIFDRAEQTTKALFSKYLWTENGLLSEEGHNTFWDRATLYALRGVMASGDTKSATKYLEAYTQKRLLGEHVPYPVEAYPEGNQRHLSAESALYCRIFTEGLFGIRPTGFKSFNLRPNIPSAWNEMSLKNIQAFGKEFDLHVKRVEGKIQIKVVDKQKIYVDIVTDKLKTINIKF